MKISDNTMDPQALLGQFEEIEKTFTEGADSSSPLAKSVAELLAANGVSFKFVQSDASGVDGDSPLFEIELPPLDDPDPTITVKVDMAKLAAMLKLDSDETQAKQAQRRIDSQKRDIQTQADARMKKIEKSLTEMDKAARASMFQKVFGWIAVGIACVVAVAACVATGGLALGAVVGAVVALGMQICNETGLIEDLTQAFADQLEEWGMKKETAKIFASVVIAVAEIAISIASGAVADKIAKVATAAKAISTVATGAKAASSAVKTTGTVLRTMADFTNAIKNLRYAAQVKAIMTAAKCLLFTGGIAGGAAAGITGYESQMASADVTRAEEILKRLRQLLDETEQELEEIMEMLNLGPEQIAKLIDTAVNAQLEIASRMGNMA